MALAPDAAVAAAAGLNQGQVQDILANHDRVRKSTDLPLFYGRKEKDSVTARLLIDRFQTASRIANWDANQVRKIEEFYLILRDRALIWWKSLEDIPDFPIDGNGRYNNWNRVKDEFLAAYAVRYTAKSACTNFQDLVQRSGENVQDFYLRVSEAYQRLRESRPEAMFAVRYGVNPPVEADIKKEGIDDMGRFFLHQLFLAGLKEDVRVKTMEAGHDTLQLSLATARETEAILNDKSKRSLLSAIQQERADIESEEFEDFFSNYLANRDDSDLEPWEENYVDKVNAIRMQNGKRPFKAGGGKRPFNKATVICRYCNIKGHFQKECKKRLREGKPQVDAQGKPYLYENKLHPIRDEDEDGEEENISALSYYGINSIRRKHLN
jgi:Retrotransposon gag protein